MEEEDQIYDLFRYNVQSRKKAKEQKSTTHIEVDAETMKRQGDKKLLAQLKILEEPKYKLIRRRFLKYVDSNGDLIKNRCRVTYYFKGKLCISKGQIIEKLKEFATSEEGMMEPHYSKLGKKDFNLGSTIFSELFPKLDIREEVAIRQDRNTVGLEDAEPSFNT